MLCQVCGKEIGPLRRIWDRRFCSDRHKKAAERLSARAVREARDYDDLEEPWLITVGIGDERPKTAGSGVGPAAGILLVVFVIFVVLIVPPGSGGGAAGPQRPQKRYLSVPGQIKKLLPGAPSVDYTDDFRNGLGEWVGSVGDGASGWVRRSGKIELGRLRIWKPTLLMSDYQMVFQGEIETKAMGWAFRASDVQNYYATKLAVPGPGGPPRPEIIRYAVVNGQRVDKVELPLPLTLEANVPYKVRVLVKDNAFSTTINGQIVDTWRDARHHKGGIGFFSEPGERALISWVRVNDADGFLSRLFSFSLLMGPTDLMMGPPGRY